MILQRTDEKLVASHNVLVTIQTHMARIEDQLDILAQSAHHPYSSSSSYQSSLLPSSSISGLNF